MLRSSVALALVASAGLVTLAAQRIVTHPAEPHLKQLFPQAVAFSPHGGTPLHYKAYGVDPKSHPSAPPIGLVFWTTDVVPNEHGYHGPVHLLVGMDMTGILSGAVVVYHSEPYGYFSVEPQEFAAQFKGKSVRAPFRVGGDVHAVSRATISITSAARAVRDSARVMAKQFLDPASVK
jgi:NosR/NirI family transcriptional regulator, nitrous oxide reductase regulator